MTQFGVLAIATLIFSKAWNDSITGNKMIGYDFSDKAVALLSVLSGVASVVFLILALITAPWGSVL